MAKYICRGKYRVWWFVFGPRKVLYFEGENNHIFFWLNKGFGCPPICQIR